MNTIRIATGCTHRTTIIMNYNVAYETPTFAIYVALLGFNGKLMNIRETERNEFTLWLSAPNRFGIPGTYKIYLKPVEEKPQGNHKFMPTPGAYIDVNP